MPREQMSEQQLAAYLHMDVRDLRKLASRGNIPCRRVGGQFVFTKGEVDHWVESQLHEMPPDRLLKIQRGVTSHHGLESDVPLIAPMIPDKGIAVPLAAKTRPAALRKMVDQANACGLLHDPRHVLDEVTRREDLCTTALWPLVALPHPRHPLPYDITESFVVVGLMPTGIPFGAEDGSLTRLLIMLCCKDERTHLHVLARLSSMLKDSDALAEMLDCDDDRTMRELLTDRELAVLRHA